MTFQYEKSPDKIYEQSFSIIRKEAELSSFSNLEEKIAVRMIHALGFVGLEEYIQFTPGFVSRVRDALGKGARIICDTKMVSEGITKARLPANNHIICTLNDKSVPEIAKRISNTRTAAAIHLWEDYIQGSLIVFGNAPTALFYLLEFLSKKKDLKPAGIIGCPVGFVGAAESKQALIEVKTLNSLVVKGRLGGSAVAVAAVNALAQEKE